MDARRADLDTAVFPFVPWGEKDYMGLSCEDSIAQDRIKRITSAGSLHKVVLYREKRGYHLGGRARWRCLGARRAALKFLSASHPIFKAVDVGG